MRKYVALVMFATSFVTAAQEQSAVAPRLLRADELTTSVAQAALQRQFNALQTMRLNSIQYSPRGPVQYISGSTGIVLPASTRQLKEGDLARDVLPLVNDIFLANGNETFTVRANEMLDESTYALRLSQSIRGIPVFHGRVAMSYDRATLRVTAVNGNFVPDRGLPSKPNLSASEAELIVPEALKSVANLREAQIEILEGTFLAYYANWGERTPPQLVWVVSLMLGSSHELFFVDAMTGAIAGRHQETTAITTSIHNANFTSPTIPNGLPSPMTEPQIQANQEAREARDFVLDANSKLLQRFPYAASSFPSSSKIVINYVFKPSDGVFNPNATHTLISGIDYLRFSGPTNGWNSFTKPRDIAVHEFGHGIGKRAAGFGGDRTSDDQVGALHEFISDVMAISVDVQYRGTGPDETWRIAEGLFPNNPAGGFRSFRHPLYDFFMSPAHNNWFPSRSFGQATADMNSTILGHAYYLMVFGGQHEDVASSQIPDISVTALAPLPAASELIASNIIMRAFRNVAMDGAPVFSTLKAAAMSEALSQYGSVARDNVKTAFEAVGICHENSAPPTSAPLVQIEDFFCAGRFMTSWPAMPGVSRYYAEVGPAQFGFAFGTPVTDVDGGTNQCMFQTTGPMVYRIRGCNSCGCGPWSPTSYLPYWSPCL